MWVTPNCVEASSEARRLFRVCVLWQRYLTSYRADRPQRADDVRQFCLNLSVIIFIILSKLLLYYLSSVLSTYHLLSWIGLLRFWLIVLKFVKLLMVGFLQCKGQVSVPLYGLLWQVTSVAFLKWTYCSNMLMTLIFCCRKILMWILLVNFQIYGSGPIVMVWLSTFIKLKK